MKNNIKNYKITIFTPTYNRAELLVNLYNSLKAQTKKDFEWIIIDDESGDNTKEVVNSWIKFSDFPIRYYKQTHGGKHRALNKAFDLALGEYFFTVDSDDTLTKNAIELVIDWIDQTKDFENIAAVAGLKIQTNNVVCGGMPITNKKGYIDATNFERDIFNLNCDKAEIYKTEILKKYKYPEYINEYFVTEEYAYMQVAKMGYKIRWFNEPIYICEYYEDGLSKSGANSYIGHKNNFNGYRDYIKKCLECKPILLSINNLVEYNQTMKQLNVKIKDRHCNINLSPLKYVLLIYVAKYPIKLTYKLYKKWRLLKYVINNKKNN